VSKKPRSAVGDLLSEAIANDEDLPDELAYAVMKKIADKLSS
jgi:hypothetical protein